MALSVPPLGQVPSAWGPAGPPFWGVFVWEVSLKVPLGGHQTLQFTVQASELIRKIAYKVTCGRVLLSRFCVWIYIGCVRFTAFLRVSCGPFRYKTRVLPGLVALGAFFMWEVLQKVPLGDHRTRIFKCFIALGASVCLWGGQ